MRGTIYEFDFNGIDKPIEPHKTGVITFNSIKLKMRSYLFLIS